MFKKSVALIALATLPVRCWCWGFYMHQQINYHAVFLLPPPMMIFYKPNIGYLSEHAVDPDKRRYMVAAEGARHYMDIDHYGKYPYPDLPHDYTLAVAKFSLDSLRAYGIVPWWVQTMLGRLTRAFREKNAREILKYSAEIGHYIADAHVPLHASSNHNGQLTGQEGIHGFWESRIPEIFAEKEWDFFIGPASYIPEPGHFIWDRLLQSAAAADTVLRVEWETSRALKPDGRYSFEERNGKLVKQYSTAYATLYANRLDGMIERRMRLSIHAVASFWYTAWVNAGQPALGGLQPVSADSTDQAAFSQLNLEWKKGQVLGRAEPE